MQLNSFITNHGLIFKYIFMYICMYVHICIYVYYKTLRMLDI